MLDTVKTSAQRLNDVREFIESKLRESERLCKEHGTSCVGLLEEATRLSALLSGDEGQVRQKLLKWYEGNNGEVHPALFLLIGSYLLSVELITEEKQVPKFPLDGRPCEKAVDGFRDALADTSKVEAPDGSES